MNRLLAGFLTGAVGGLLMLALIEFVRWIRRRRARPLTVFDFMTQNEIRASRGLPPMCHPKIDTEGQARDRADAPLTPTRGDAITPVALPPLKLGVWHDHSGLFTMQEDGSMAGWINCQPCGGRLFVRMENANTLEPSTK